jgi:hypothetical protein
MGDLLCDACGGALHCFVWEGKIFQADPGTFKPHSFLAMALQSRSSHRRALSLLFCPHWMLFGESCVGPRFARFAAGPSHNPQLKQKQKQKPSFEGLQVVVTPLQLFP